MRTACVRLPGHPDHACDMVAEAIVDEYVRRDPQSRLRVNVVGGRGVMFVSGDILSTADFDVSALVKRTISSLGVTDEVEPFVSLEAVSAERVAAVRLPADSPTTVTGYATAETPSMLPETVALARRLARVIYEAREQNPEWFWLGPDAEVVVLSERRRPERVRVNVEHGTEPLESVRKRLCERLQLEAPGVRIEVNPVGAQERRGLSVVSGASGQGSSVYGSFVPGGYSGIGRDPSSIEKAGTWLVRAAARRAVAAGARSALVQATYFPEETQPHFLSILDEQGRNISASVPLETLSLDRVMKEWWRPGLSSDAARWGFAGEPGLPWEDSLAM